MVLAELRLLLPPDYVEQLDQLDKMAGELASMISQFANNPVPLSEEESAAKLKQFETDMSSLCDCIKLDNKDPSNDT
jgi:hypothetical protein